MQGPLSPVQSLKTCVGNHSLWLLPSLADSAPFDPAPFAGPASLPLAPPLPLLFFLSLDLLIPNETRWGQIPQAGESKKVR